MQLWISLMRLGAALLAAGSGRAVAQESVYFDAGVPSPTCENSTAGAAAVTAVSEIECAVKCSQIYSSRSFSFISGVCMLYYSPNCAVSSAVKVLTKRLQSSLLMAIRGYAQQIGERAFWVFQQRQNGQVSFARNWMEYEQGFGDVTAENDGEFWSGLRAISNASLTRNSTLRIEMTTVDGIPFVAEWLNFTVSDASTNYTMNYNSYLSSSSNLSCDTLSIHRGRQFGTVERDTTSCAASYGSGGFWWGNCYSINPNGLYPPSLQSTSQGTAYICSQCAMSYRTMRFIRMMLQV